MKRIIHADDNQSGMSGSLSACRKLISSAAAIGSKAATQQKLCGSQNLIGRFNPEQSLKRIQKRISDRQKAAQSVVRVRWLFDWNGDK